MMAEKTMKGLWHKGGPLTLSKAYEKLKSTLTFEIKLLSYLSKTKNSFYLLSR